MNYSNCSTEQSLFTTRDATAQNFTYPHLAEDCKILPFIIKHTVLILFSRMSPFVIFLILVTNILVCIVLTRRHMVSPTNLILLGIAIADMLTSLSPLPIYIVNNIPRGLVYLTAVEGYFRNVLESYLPTVFHTVSIWLTVALAVQRCIYVIMPTEAVTICTIDSSLRTIGSVYVLAFFSHSILLITKFVEFDRVCVDASTGLVSVVEKRVLFRCNPIGDTPKLVQLWLRIFTCNVIPCISLIIFTIILCIFIRRSEAKRRKLTSKSSEQGRMKETNSTSKMLIFVLIIFLVVEIPSGTLLLFYRYWGRWKYYSDATSYTNFCILVSYPINFFVYYAMSRQFRDTFRSLFGLSASGAGNNTVRKAVKAMAIAELEPLRDRPEQVERPVEGQHHLYQAVPVVNNNGTEVKDASPLHTAEDQLVL